MRHAFIFGISCLSLLSSLKATENGTDACNLQYSVGTGRKGKQFCVDPYLGGSASCCFDSRKSCRTCPVSTDCASSKNLCENRYYLPF
mmetsp:Transcript_36631/g.96501  ORF Transcript_36631/g.96501 Transcript_36631/m.96501 type:complete len:88 (+) Transcript_36631:84-347(+)